jgi:glutathione synthase/RimK-type ligase-like ATP-grasp enzyme
MNTYILTFINSSIYNRPSGYKLAELSGFIPVNSLRHIDTKDNILIRYGVLYFPTRDEKFKFVFNKSNVIRQTQDKLFTSEYLFNRGIYTPRIWTDKSEIDGKDLPVLRRLRYHSRGTDIKFIESKKELKKIDGDYFIKYIKSDIEYRLHIFMNQPIRLQKKVLDNMEKKSHFIHNVEHGYLLKDNFEHDIDLEKNLIAECKLASYNIGIDFGAIDVLIDSNNQPLILEINSAPRLNKYGRQLYIYHFYKWLNENADTNYNLDLKFFPRLRENNSEVKELGIEFRDLIKTSKEE